MTTANRPQICMKGLSMTADKMCCGLALREFLQIPVRAVKWVVWLGTILVMVSSALPCCQSEETRQLLSWQFPVLNIIISSLLQRSGGLAPLLSSDLLSGGRKESEAAASFPVVLTGNIVRDLTVISPLTQPGDAARRNTGGTSLHPLSLPPAL